MSISSSAEEAMKSGYITGLHTDTGKIEPRLEIDEFVLDRDVLNIFLLALINLQGRNYDDPWSWFQIAGIHGQPFNDWDDVGPKPVEEDADGPDAGYCAHSSVTFPTWHRPYVTMMEQAVYVEMLQVARSFDGQDAKQKYLNACERFRFPYWDPCLPREVDFERESGRSRPEFGVPRIVSSRKVYLRKPHSPNVLSLEDNPLYQYKFPSEFQYPRNLDSFWNHRSSNELFNSPALKGTTHTVRAPDENGQTDDLYINSYISNHIQGELGIGLYKVLNLRQNWDSFSNDVLDARAQVEASKHHVQYVDHSLEGFHDNIHVVLGQGRLRNGSGHIGYPQYAAFDPLFWLHHCNIDRVTALWQVKQGLKNPSSWWDQQPLGERNWAISRGTVQTPKDDLKPFRRGRRDPGNEIFWTSEDVRKWSVLGYTYLGKKVRGSSGQNELVSFPIDFSETSQEDLNTYFNQFYGWMDIAAPGYPALIGQFYPINLSEVEALTGRSGPDRPSALPSHPSGIPGDEPPNPNEVDYSHMPEHIRQNNQLRQWDIHIVAEKFKFNGTYQVFVFLGQFNSGEPNNWPSDDCLVGINGIWSNNPRSGGCANCEQQADSKLTVMDVIPLTPHLIKWISLGKKCPSDDPEGVACQSLEYDQVSPFLKKNLHWRVADMNLNVIESEVEGINVYAADRIVTLPTKYQDAVQFGDRYAHHDVAERPTYPEQEDQDITVEYRDRPHGEGRDYAPTREDDGKTEGGYKSKSAEQYDGGNAGEERQEQEGEEREEGRKFCGMRCNVL